MKLPFSTKEFLNVFGHYNSDVWPIQVVFNIVALASVALIFRNRPGKDRTINAILSFFWFWMGIVYHIIYFSSINSAAIVFGALFVIQGFLFAYKGVAQNKLRYQSDKSIYSTTGFVLVIYGLIVYPLLSNIFGHDYPNTPTFGLPCPTTIFTLGLLLFCVDGIRWYIVIIPILWSMIGVSAAINLSIKQDYFLALAGIASIGLFIARKHQIKAVDGSSGSR